MAVGKTNADKDTTYSLSKSGSTITLTGSDGSKTTVTDSNTTYSAATTSAAGLMSASDKSKLDAITASADAVSFSRSLTSGTKIGTITINGTATDLYCQTNTNTTYSQATSSTLGLVKIGYSENGKNYPVELNSDGQMFVNVPWTDTDTNTNTTYSLSKSGSTITLTGSDGSKTTVTDSNTTYSTFVKSGSSAAAGLVPAPSTTAGTTKYLREDGTWTVPPDTNTTYSAATTSAAGLMSASDKSKLDAITASADAVSFSRSLTSGTKIGTITINGAATDLYCQTNTNTTYSAMTGATSSAAGTSGLVPAPAAGKQTSFLRGDGTWVVPTNTTYSNFVKSGSGAKAGLVPAPSTTAGTTKYLREDGTWTVPPDTNTTYSAATTSANGLMTAAMVTKLNGIATGANAYSLPTASSSTLGGVKTTSTVTSTSGLTACPIISGVPYYKDTNTTYTSLKNPNALTVKGNGTQSFTYDGSAAKTLNIKAGTNVSVSSDTSGNITINSSMPSHQHTGLVKGDYTAILTDYGNFRLDEVTTVDETGTIGTEDIPWRAGYFSEGVYSKGNRIPDIACGTVSAASVSALSYLDFTITFPITFKTVPIVSLTLFSTSKDGQIGQVTAAIYSVSTTQCVARVFNGSAAAKKPGLRWVAFGTKA